MAAGSRAALAAALLTAGGVASAWMVAARTRWSRRAAASAIERACPGSRNVVVTARELIDDPERGQRWIRTRVFEDAAKILEGTDQGAVVPIASAAARAGAGLALLVVVVMFTPDGAVRHTALDLADRATAALGSSPHELTVVATVVAPDYLRVEPVRHVDPERLDAVQGSRATLEIRPADPGVRLRFGSTRLALEADRSRLISEVSLSQSGYFAIEREGGTRRLVPVVVTPDRTPVIRVEAPAKDLLLPDATPTIPVSATAADDYGLASLDLRYTKVSGSGEQFEFEEGVMPLEVQRSDPRNWRAQGSLPLSRLALEPGDSLVYRVVGRDARSGDAGVASSDTYFVEIAGPGQVALAGFEMPPDRERYALSQQMIVLKIERLRARERAMPRPELEKETGDIAAEQRAVRANFIFLLGGQVEDEVEEAEHSHEIQEGRLENTARREIDRAIGHMSIAERSLVAIDTTTALAEAKAAVRALQLAFGRNRYILRTMPVRSRLDPSRRLSGALDAAADWRRDRPPADRDAEGDSARALYARLLALAPSVKAGAVQQADGIATLAEDALRVDPAAREWQTISQSLSRLRESLASGRTDAEVSATMRQALDALSAATRRRAMTAPDAGTQESLRSAWADAQSRK